MKAWLLLSTFLTLALAGCGGGGKSATPACAGPSMSCVQLTSEVAVAQRTSGTVELYPQTFAGAPVSSLRLPGAESFAWSFTADTPRTLFIGEYPGTIAQIDYPYTSPDGAFTTGVNDPAGLAIGTTPTGNATFGEALFVANRGANQVAVYLIGSSAPAFTLGGLHAPNAIAFDDSSSGGATLWVSEAGDVVEYASPITAASTIMKTISAGLSAPSGIAFDNSGNMYVTDSAQNAIVVYAPGSSSPLTTVTNGLNRPLNPYVDGLGTKLYVPNLGSNAVAVFTLPLSAASTPVLVNGNEMNGPSAVTVGAF